MNKTKLSIICGATIALSLAGLFYADTFLTPGGSGGTDTGALHATNNLSDLASKQTALNNLGQTVVMVNLRATGGSGTALAPWTGWDTGFITDTTYQWSPGYYGFTSTLNLVPSTGQHVVHLTAGQQTHLVYSGATGAGTVAVQAVTTSSGEQGTFNDIGGFNIDAGAADIGLKIDSVHFSDIGAMRIHNAASKAMLVLFAVGNRYAGLNVRCVAGGDSVVPVNGLYIGDHTGSNKIATASTWNCIGITGVSGDGIVLDNCWGIKFVGGFSELSGGWGMSAMANGFDNDIDSMDFEGNGITVSGAGSFWDAGGNTWKNITHFSSGAHCHFKLDAPYCKLDGGYYTAASGSTLTTNCTYPVINIPTLPIANITDQGATDPTIHCWNYHKTPTFNTGVVVPTRLDMPASDTAGNIHGNILLCPSPTGDNLSGGFIASGILYPSQTGTTPQQFGFQASVADTLDIRNTFKQYVVGAGTYNWITMRYWYSGGWTHRVGIFNDTPAYELDVTGAINTSTFLRIAPGAAPASPSEGMVYANSTDHHLYFYNGSTWKQLDN